MLISLCGMSLGVTGPSTTTSIPPSSTGAAGGTSTPRPAEHRSPPPTLHPQARHRPPTRCRSMTTLVVIRGNSASGKSTVAAGLQRRFEHGHCAVIGQDVVRRQIVRERDEPGGWNIELIEHIATLCLARGMVTIVEGILDADRYGAMLHRLADTAGCALHYGFDLTFDETL